MAAVASMVQEVLPPDTGFMLLSSPMGANGIAQFVSNVDRSCGDEWMRETLARWDSGDFVER